MSYGTKLKTGLLLSVMLVASCGMSGPTDGCAGWKPIYLSEQTIDSMADADAKAVLSHNEYGVERGCWSGS